MNGSSQQDKELEGLIKDLLKDHRNESIETKLRKENKRLGDKGKMRDKLMDVMCLVNSYQDDCGSDKYKCPFKPGDIVTWKKGMRNRSAPSEDQLAIVLQVLDKPYIREGYLHF